MAAKSEFTNLDFAYFAVLVAQLVIAAAFLHPFNDVGKTVGIIGVMLAVNFLAIVALAFLRVKVIPRDSAWLQPASQHIGTLVLNTVTVLLLALLALMTYAILATKGSPGVVWTAVLVVVAAGFVGRYFQKRSRTKSLLPYGLSGLGAFAIILAGVLALKALG
jgi:hypothetical protein